MDWGILLVDKKEGLSSRRIDNLAMKKTGISKCGHLGTLDPFATGLLVLALGKATKLLPYLDSTTKSYIACLHLGEKKDTGDLTGKTVAESPVPEFETAQISAILDSFLGKSLQIPPSFSALKIDGREAYKLARQGQEVDLKPREIEITSIHLISYDPKTQDLVFTCTVSSGTYIRTLGEDIAAKLGTVGYLSALRRLSVGPFLVANAKDIDEITKDDLLDPLLYIRGMKHVEIDEGQIKDVKNGMPLDIHNDYGEKIFVCFKGEALAVYKKKEGSLYSCERGLWA